MPFPAGTQGRDKMLRLFSLHHKLSQGSYTELLMSDNARLSLLHFSHHQLKLQTKGKLTGKRFSKLRPPQCWDESLLQRKQDVDQLLFQDAQEAVVLPTRDVAPEVDPDTLDLNQQVAYFKALAEKRLLEAQALKLRVHRAEALEEQRRAELARTIDLLEKVETDAQALLRGLDSMGGAKLISMEALESNKYLLQNIRRLTSFYTVRWRRSRPGCGK